MTNICPNCGFPNDPGVTVCRKCRHAYSASGADHTAVDIYSSPDAPQEPAGPVGGAALKLDFSDEVPPGDGPGQVASDLKREIPLDRRIARPIADKKAVAEADTAGAAGQPAPGPGRHRAPSIVAIESLPPSDPGKPEPSELGAAAVFADTGPVAPGTDATPAPKVSAPGIPVHESWIEDSEPAKPLDLTAAGLIRRSVSAVIDLAILSAASAAVAWLGLVSFGTSPALASGLQDTAKAVESLALPLALLLAVTTEFYSLTFHFLGGRTIGKMVTGTRLITTSGKPVSLHRAFWRTVCLLFTCATLLIGFLWILMDERGQALHDKLAGTYVIVDD